MTCVGSSPALATCETSHVLLASLSGGFPGELPFRPTFRLACLDMGVHCVCMLLLVQGVCCLDICFRHISLAPLRIKFTVNAQHIRYIAIRYTIELKKTQVASVGDVLGVHCVCMLLLVQGVCCLDIVFRHITLAPLRIKFHRDCSAQKIYCHSITFTCLLRLNSTDTIKVALLLSFVHVFNITLPKW